jgi:hypothetical protein
MMQTKTLDSDPSKPDSPSIGRLQQWGATVGMVGLLAGGIGAFTNLDQFFWSWLIGFLFCLGLALGSLGFLMLHHLSGGKWGLVSRRVFEASTRTLPMLLLFFVPVVLGLPRIFLWAQPDKVQADAVLQAKAPYLNVTFFTIRAAVYFAFWIFCMWLLTKWSAGQDRGEVATTRADSVRFRTLSAPGLLFLALTLTFASVDWIMSVDPHWFSTIFGLLTLVSHGLSALAFTIAVLAMLAPEGLSKWARAEQFHDLGKLLLAFVMLWAYLGFSQFLIIWSGNLPEELPWYIARVRGAWGIVALVLVVGHFALPFALLLSRDLKRHPHLLARVAWFVLVVRLFDTIWLVAPTLTAGHGAPAGDHAGFSFPIHWMNFAIPIGLAGVWVFLFARLLRSRALLPLNDPYFKEAFANDGAH